MEGDAIEQGREAWGRLRDRDRKAWSDWVALGHALRVGRQTVMQKAGARTPHGKIYTRLTAVWLREHGLDDVPPQARYRVLLCIDSLPDIEKFRAKLSAAQRDKLNHPDSNFYAWQRAKSEKTRKFSRPDRPKMPRSLGPRPTQDRMRYVAAALREAWNGDFYVLAEAAIVAVDASRMALPEPVVVKQSPRRQDRAEEQRISP